MSQASPDFSDPAAARLYLLELEFRENRLRGLGWAIAQVGGLAVVAALIDHKVGQVVDISAMQEVGQGGVYVGLAMIATGGVCTVYERLSARTTKRRMHSFVSAWVDSKWPQV